MRRAIGVLSACVLALGGCASAPREGDSSWRSRRVRTPGPLALVDAESPAWINLSPGGGTPAIYESPAIHEEFVEALVSWNVHVPRGARVRFEVRVSPTNTGRDWTPWMFVGEVGEPAYAGEIVREGGVARVDVDSVRCERACKRFQWRAIAERVGGTGEGVVLRRMAVTLTRENPRAGERHGEPALQPPPPGRARRLDVPFLSQKTDDPALAGRLCSPTSVAMVLRYLGVATEVQSVAKRAYDARHDLYGNWPRNMQAVFELGAYGEVTRLSSWREVERLIDRGLPVVISFKAQAGELRHAPYRETDGHLIVVTGFDERGDVCVNDPAASTAEEGKRVYLREDLTRVWLEGNKGTCYIVSPKSAR